MQPHSITPSLSCLSLSMFPSLKSGMIETGDEKVTGERVVIATDNGSRRPYRFRGRGRESPATPSAWLECCLCHDNRILMHKIGSGSGVAGRGGVLARLELGRRQSLGVDAGKNGGRNWGNGERERRLATKRWAMNTTARRALLTHPNHRRRVALPFPRVLFIRIIIVLIVLDGPGAVFACRNHPVAFFLMPHRPPAEPCAHIPPFHRIHRCHTGLRRLRVGIAHTCRCPLAWFPPGHRKRGYRYWGSLCLLRRLCLRRS